MTFDPYETEYFVDFATAIERFMHVTVQAIPEMQARKATAAWVLSNRQMRMRDIRSPFTYRRLIHLDDAKLKQADELRIHRSALAELQKIHKKLLEARIIPISKVPRIIKILAGFPVVNVRQMADYAKVSEATAKRWLKAMTGIWLMEEKYANGQNQYLTESLLQIIDENSR